MLLRKPSVTATPAARCDLSDVLEWSVCMHEAVLIKGNKSIRGTIFVAMAGLVALGAGVLVLWVAKPVPAAMLVLTGLVICKAASIGHAVNVRRRVYLEIDDGGFRVRDRHGEVDYCDEDVSALAVDVEQVCANGTIIAIRRRATLQVAGITDAVIQMDYTFPPGENADPLGELFGRLRAMLLARFREQVANGRQVAGEGWSLADEMLVICRGDTQERHRCGDLAAVNLVEHQVYVWERGTAEPVLRVPLTTLNAWALAALLQERLPVDAAHEDERVADGLGRIIFDRDKSWSPAVVVAAVLVALGLASGGIALISLGVLQHLNGMLTVGVGMALLAGAIATLTLCYHVNILRVHSLGVTRTTVFGTRDIRYAEVGKFTWSGVRQFVHGVYTGTTLQIALEPLPGTLAPAVHCELTHQGSDQELDGLRDGIAGTIANRWLAELQDGAAVPWTGNSVFRHAGLEHRKGWFRARRLIAYGKLLRWEVRGGWLYVYGPEGKTLVQEQCKQTNFFPGLALLQSIMHEGGIPPLPAKTRHPSAEPPRTGEAQVDERIQHCSAHIRSRIDHALQ
jgi:hypothetical protein